MQLTNLRKYKAHTLSRPYQTPLAPSHAHTHTHLQDKHRSMREAVLSAVHTHPRRTHNDDDVLCEMRMWLNFHSSVVFHANFPLVRPPPPPCTHTLKSTSTSNCSICCAYVCVCVRVCAMYPVSLPRQKWWWIVCLMLFWPSSWSAKHVCDRVRQSERERGGERKWEKGS